MNHNHRRALRLYRDWNCEACVREVVDDDEFLDSVRDRMARRLQRLARGLDKSKWRKTTGRHDGRDLSPEEESAVMAKFWTYIARARKRGDDISTQPKQVPYLLAARRWALEPRDRTALAVKKTKKTIENEGVVMAALRLKHLGTLKPSKLKLRSRRLAV